MTQLPMYRSLNADKVVETAQKLTRRVSERFTDSGLASVCAEIAKVAQEARERAEEIRKPITWLWFVKITLFCSLAGALLVIMAKLAWVRIPNVVAFIAFLEQALAILVYLSAAVVFLFSIEGRIKRTRALTALHELRSLVHVLDMHQLTKDPERLLKMGPTTASSPTFNMTPFELGRYLDYCDEAMSLLAKIATIYAQEMSEPTALATVDQVESLAASYSQKIWHKLEILERFWPTSTRIDAGSNDAEENEASGA